MKISRRSLLSALPLYPAARLLRGQQNPAPTPKPGAAESPTFSADVKVVNIFATVRDKKGQIVDDLTQDDFVLDEDGRPQTIKYFALDSNLPLTLGLLVDTSVSQLTVINEERTASYRFFDQILREDRDLSFVIRFDYEVKLLQDLTPSRQMLEKALDKLQIARAQLQRQGGGGYPGSGGGGYPGGGPGGGTDLYDAVLLASNEHMKKQGGRKALVLLTDGVDTGSKGTLFQAIESAQRSDTLVYSVFFADPNAYGSTDPPFDGTGGARMGRQGQPYPYPYPQGVDVNLPDGKKILRQISRATGGRFFEVSRRQPIDKVFAEIEEDLRNQYNVGYTSDAPGNGNVYRHVHLTAKNKGYVVQAREGYYAS